MSVEASLHFMHSVLGPAMDRVPPERRDPSETIELLWPLLEPFQQERGEAVRNMAYDPRREREVDEMLVSWADSGRMERPIMAPAAERVFLERLKQFFVISQANSAMGKMLVTPPRMMPEHQRRIAAALLWLHEMELPMPLNDPMLQ